MSPYGLTYPADLRLFTLELANGASMSDATSDRTWHVVDHSAALGHGEACFRAASYRLNSWRTHSHARVGVELISEEDARGTDIVRLHFGPTTSPCAIIYREHSKHRTVMVYGTLAGHVECGEEAFIVELASDGTVTGRCVAFSKHAWWLAKLGAPVARWVQRRENRLYVEGMRPQRGEQHSIETSGSHRTFGKIQHGL